MKTFILLVVLPVSAVLTFFSGALPYTLIYDEASLQEVQFEGNEPISTEVVTCEIRDTANLSIGAELETTFRATLHNHTDRYVAVSAIGEVFSPTGHSAGMNSKLIILSPNAEENAEFRSYTPYTGSGKYKCEMRSAIGRF